LQLSIARVKTLLGEKVSQLDGSDVVVAVDVNKSKHSTYVEVLSASELLPDAFYLSFPRKETLHEFCERKSGVCAEELFAVAALTDVKVGSLGHHVRVVGREGQHGLCEVVKRNVTQSPVKPMEEHLHSLNVEVANL
jgi:hypothetical protein